MREQHLQEIRDRELKVARERELREREVQVGEVDLVTIHHY